MSPVWANLTQDTLGSGKPHKHRTIGGRYPRATSTMGTLFEPAFGGFPGMDSYGSKSFVSFGPPVDFEAGFGRPEQWQNEKGYHNETSLSSEMPELSSRPSSRNSSRPSSFHSSSQGSQRSSYGSLPDPEPYTFGLNPEIVDYETIGQDSHVWSSYNGPEYPSWPLDYSFADPTSIPVYNMVPPMRSYLPEGPFSIASAEPFQNAKLQMPASSTSNCQLSYQSYPYPPGRPSLASHISCSNQGEPFDSFQASEKLSGKCPIPDCKKGFKDLKAHMLTHSRERTEKCPIVTCDYHIKGFCRKYDKNRHTLTHFRSTIVCSFCPGRGTEVEKTFNRADVFKRHLVSVHGVEHTPPPTSRRNSSSKCTIPPIEFPERYWLGVKGKCSICSGIFADAQVFYNHLDECVINSVLRLASSSSANTSQKIEVESSTSVMDHAEKSRVSDTVHWVINKGDDYGRKRRKDYPPSWGSHADQMKIKKRVICAYDGTRRLWKDETILGSDFEANIPWSHGESYATDLDALTTKKPEVSFDEHWCKADDKFMTFEIKPKDHSFDYVDTSLFHQYGTPTSVACKGAAKSTANRLPLPQKTLTDGDRRIRYRHHVNNLVAKQTDTAVTFGVERSTVSKVLRRKEKFLLPSDRKLVLEPSGVQVPLLKSPLPEGQSSPAEDTKQTIACKKEDLESEKKDLDWIRPWSPPPTKRDDIVKGCDMIVPNCQETDQPNVDTPKVDHGASACSPVTDVSDDVSDNESVSDCSTEWGEDQITSSPGSDVYRILDNFPKDHTEGDKSLLRPILSPMKQALVDRIMAEFWTIVNQEWAASLTKCAGETPASSSPPGSNGSLIGGSSPQMVNRKRQRDDGEDPPPEDNNGRTPKRPNSQSKRPLPKNGVKFACPYRKHAPHRYTIYKHRSCALSHWDTVARVKEHLYRQHRVPIQCKRCWQTFKAQEALDAHLTVLNICPLQTGQAAEGLTPDLEKRLKSRKKSSPDQTEEARWKEIYALLFPNEVVPNPYFEPVQENAPQSPDSRELADYEEYSRQELPRAFRSYLEDAVNNETQHLEEHIRSQLVSIVQDCQARTFSAYKSKVANKGGKPTPESAAIDACVTPSSSEGPSEEALDSSKAQSRDIVTSIYQAPTPQSTVQYVPDLRNIQSSDAPSKIAENISFSDSAYSSNGSSGSQATTILSQTREPAIAKPSDELYGQFSLRDNGTGVDVDRDLSFEGSYNITLDMNDPDYGWWANLNAEAEEAQNLPPPMVGE